MNMEEIRVLVPAERVTEFYRWFADWRDAVPREAPAVRQEGKTPDADRRFRAAVNWWKSLKPSERGVWGVWIDAAPEMVSADKIVELLGLKGRRDIPGILSWSNRKGVNVGFDVDWRFRYDPVSEAPLYGIENPGYADLLRRARDTVVDGTSREA